MRTNGTNTSGTDTVQSNANSRSLGKYHVKLPKFLRRNCKSDTNIPIPTISDIPDKTPICQPQVEEILTFEQNLEKRLLSVAGQQLIERENRLYGQSPREAEREEEEQIAEDHKALLSLIKQALSDANVWNLTEERLAALKSAVKAIQQEEEQDRQWQEREGNPPVWRPSHCGHLHDKLIHDMVEKRMDEVEAQAEGQSSVQKDICRMGRCLKEDLVRVVEVVKGCYPEEMDICNLYAKMYHQAFSTRLAPLAEFDLVIEDCSYVLRWVNDFYPNMLKKQQEIDHETLGKLLPDELMKSLENQYVVHKKEEVDTIIHNVLKEETSGAVPEFRDQHYFSPLAIDVIQCINGGEQSVKLLLGDSYKGQMVVCLLKTFLDRYKEFQQRVVKGSNGNTKEVIMANLACVEQFRDYIAKNIEGDLKDSCLSIVTDMKNCGYTYLTSLIHKELKPKYRCLGTNDWLTETTSVIKNLLEGIDKNTQDFQGLSDPSHQELMGQLHLDVIAEYVSRLLKGNIKLKDRKRQEQAARNVCEDGQRLHKLFIKAGSKEEWLSDILPKIAEVLKLQDLPSIEMEIVILNDSYPDLSKKHVSALLYLKSNISASDRKKVKEAFVGSKEVTSSQGTRSFFSKVQVK